MTKGGEREENSETCGSAREYDEGSRRPEAQRAAGYKSVFVGGRCRWNDNPDGRKTKILVVREFNESWRWRRMLMKLKRTKMKKKISLMVMEDNLDKEANVESVRIESCLRDK